VTSFVYLSRKAKDYKAPLLLLLHGYGSNEADLFSFVPFISNNFHIASLQAPFSAFEGYAWFPLSFEKNRENWSNPDEVNQAKEFVLDFIEYYQNKYDLTNQNVILIGFSQGAMLSHSLGLSDIRIKGIAALSGYLDPRFTNFKNKIKTPIYISHGKEDMTIPYELAEQSVNLLKKKGFKPELYTYNQGHGVNKENLTSLIIWIEKLLSI
jgi:phospholipase/carboxylesterase